MALPRALFTFLVISLLSLLECTYGEVTSHETSLHHIHLNRKMFVVKYNSKSRKGKRKHYDDSEDDEYYEDYPSPPPFNKRPPTPKPKPPSVVTKSPPKLRPSSFPPPKRYPPPPKRYPPPPPPPRKFPPPRSQSPPPAPKTPNSSPGINSWLTLQNKARADLGLNPLVWNSSMAASALTWAQRLSSRGCGLVRGGNSGMGQNLAWSPSPSQTITAAVQLWIDEKPNYSYGKYPNNCSAGQCGHYTQIVWLKTKQVGCAASTASCGIVYVCHYYPPGNVVGQYPY